MLLDVFYTKRVCLDGFAKRFAVFTAELYLIYFVQDLLCDFYYVKHTLPGTPVADFSTLFFSYASYPSAPIIY